MNAAVLSPSNEILAELKKVNTLHAIFAQRGNAPYAELAVRVPRESSIGRYIGPSRATCRLARWPIEVGGRYASKPQYFSEQ